MTLFLLALAILLAGGIGSLLAGGRAQVAHALGAGAAVVSGALGATGAASMLFSKTAVERTSIGAPGGLGLQIDWLSALFLLPTFVVPALAAIFGAGCLQARRVRGPGLGWFAYDLLIASMALVLAAKGGILLLVGWETIALASFSLVVSRGERLEVGPVSWAYLAATQLGAAALLVFFVLDVRGGGAGPAASGLTFLLALLGFGATAGTASLQPWRPDPHGPPDHVSAVMVGVTSKMGIYGILRAIMLLGSPPGWWAALLLAAGAAAALGAAGCALAQRDLKRLLACSSLEHMGIVGLGAGLGVLGIVSRAPEVAFLGFGGALLHTLNHSLFQALLLLDAGAVRQATGHRALDRLGGLLRHMRDTGITALAGTLAASGLPPLNGFAGMLMLAGAGVMAVRLMPLKTAAPAGAALLALVLAAALGAVVLVRAFRSVFLGQPRSFEAEHAHEVGSPLRVPLHLLMAACLVLGLFPEQGLILVARPAVALAEPAGPALAGAITEAEKMMGVAGGIALAGIALAIVVAAVRWLRRSRRIPE